MATPATPQQLQSTTAPREKFSVEKSVHGGITYLTMSGTLNVDFIGKKIAKLVKTHRIVVNMRAVRRFASWGMSEWMDFLRITSDHDVYVVECSTYALSQLNLVTGLLGTAKLVSYYASFRCGKCGEEIESQFVIPRDREMIRDLPLSHQDCPTCGGRARLEEYPAAFFETIADRPTFDIDDEVFRFLQTELRYDITPDINQFRAHRAVKDRRTYMRLSGNMSALPADNLVKACEGTTVVDLEGALAENADLRPWHNFVTGAMDKVDSLQLNCPVGFLEHGAVQTKDLKQKLKVRTFALQYDCVHCERSSAHMIDVANNLEELATGTPPTARCPTCRASLVANVPMQLAMLLRALPARDRDPVLDKLITQCREKGNDKLENCATPIAVAAEAPGSGKPGRALYVALAMSTILVAGLGVVGFYLWKERTEKPVVQSTAGSQEANVPQDKFNRPDWIDSAVPGTAYCRDLINRVMCVGISSYRTTKEDGAADASDAALEEVVQTVALKITDPFFKDSVQPQYGDARSKLLSAMQVADLDRKTDPAAAEAYAKADEAVRSARKRVVQVLQTSGGAAVPTQRTDWYWEEYAGENGKPNDILVFVRYDISLDAMRSLVDTYSASAIANGTTAMTAFPSLGWRYADFTGGAVLTKVHRKLAAAGIAPFQIVTAVGDQKVTDAAAFTRRLGETKDAVKLTVKSGDEPAKVVDVKL
jgi:DNA-directed RNA polymerase subunit RPC12/RpoP